MRSTSDALANLITEVRDEQADDRIYMRAELKQVRSTQITIFKIVQRRKQNCVDKQWLSNESTVAKIAAKTTSST